MPRIPVILATEGVAAPQGPQFPRNYGAGAGVAGAVGKFGEAASDALFKFAEVEQKERLAGAGVEVDAAISQLKNDYDRQRTDLAQMGEPERYEQRASDAFDNLSTAAGQALRYPEGKGLYQKKVNALQSELSIKAREEGTRLQNAQTNARATLLDREDTATSVFGATPQEREAALNRLAERDIKLVGMGARSASALPQHMADIDEATARRDFDNPALRGQVIAGLTAGKYSSMAPDKQLTLRDSLITKAHSERDADRKEEDRIRKDIADEAERGIVDLVRRKDYAQAGDMLSRYGQHMSGEEKKTWAEYIDKAQTTVKSDPQTRTLLSLQVYSADTTATISGARVAVMRAVGAGQLDATDGDKYLGHLQGAAIADRNRREDKALDAYHRTRSEVKDQLKEDMRVTGPLEKLVPAAQNTYSIALQDLERNVPVAGPGNEDPRAWYNRTKAQWIGHVSSAATSRIAELERGIDEASVQRELQATQGQPSRSTLDKIRRLKDAEAIRKELEILGGKPPESAKPEDGKGKPAEGGKKLGY